MGYINRFTNNTFPPTLPQQLLILDVTSPHSPDQPMGSQISHWGFETFEVWSKLKATRLLYLILGSQTKSRFSSRSVIWRVSVCDEKIALGPKGLITSIDPHFIKSTFFRYIYMYSVSGCVVLSFEFFVPKWPLPQYAYYLMFDWSDDVFFQYVLFLFLKENII